MDIYRDREEGHGYLGRQRGETWISIETERRDMDI